MEHSETLLGSIGGTLNSIDNKADRLQVVLETKQKIACGLTEETDVNVEDADLYSETTSVTGGLSNVSRTKSNPASLQTRSERQYFCSYMPNV